MRMIAAAEAAARAADAAVAAVANASSTTASSGVKGDWYKMLSKHPNFDSKTREEELSQFRDWWWQLEQYVVTIDQLYSRDFEEIRQDLHVKMDINTMNAEEKKRGHFLFGLLASLLKGRPLMLLKGVDVGNGFEAVRQLIRSRQPSNRNRSIALMRCLCNGRISRWNRLYFHRFSSWRIHFASSRIGGQLTAETKFSIFMRCVGGQLKTYLQVTPQENTTYNDLRENIIRFDSATIKWSNAMSLGASMPGAPDHPPGNDPGGPMDVDRISKGKNKGKGKDRKGN